MKPLVCYGISLLIMADVLYSLRNPVKESYFLRKLVAQIKRENTSREKIPRDV